MKYDLSHLQQPEEQSWMGPVQDDEALLLFAVCKVICARRVLELGGLVGYSARNFLAAVGPEGKVYTVEKGAMDKQAANHIVIYKDCAELSPEDVDNLPLDLAFFDCHVYVAELKAFRTLRAANLITDKTLLAAHDTGLHPTKTGHQAYEAKDGSGFIHQWDERLLVNTWLREGWHAVNFHANVPIPPLAWRHGLTLLGRTNFFDNE